jgi:Raf kinase inhibitor-like YbhB/YbcL family protein
MLPTKLVSAVLLALIFAVAVPATAQEKSAAKSHFVLTSEDKQLAIKVPEVYTASAFGCTGGNQSPPLQWSGAPTGTKSFVLTLFDPDERSTPSGWWHWVVYDLPATAGKLSKGAGVEHSSEHRRERNKAAPISARTLTTARAQIKETRRNRYTFTIYALSVDKLDVPPDSTGAMVVSTAKEHLSPRPV